jgi:hypothetical protein
MSFSNDNVIKLDYNPVLEAQVDYLNAVGATDSLTLRTLDFTPSDANTIFVKKTGNDSTAVGTQADPVLTIKKAESLITATKVNIVILDDGVYEEESLAFDTNCANIAAAIGKKPTVKPVLVASGSNYLIETIKDTTSIRSLSGTLRGTMKAAALSNGNFVLLYEDAYSEDVFFKIYDKDGNLVLGETLVYSLTTSTLYGGICALNSGYFVTTWGGGSGGGTYKIYTNDGVLVSSDSLPSAEDGWLCYPFGGRDDAIIIVSNALNYSYGLWYMVVDINGTVLISFRRLYSGNELPSAILKRDEGGFIYVVQEEWGIVNSSGTVLHTESIETGYYAYGGVKCGNSIILAVKPTAPGTLFYLIEYSLTDYSIVRNLTLISGLSAYFIDSMSITSDNTLAINAGSNPGYVYFINNENWVILNSESFSSADSISLAYNIYTERLIIFYCLYSSPVAAYINIKGGFITNWFTFSSNITFNGISFDNDEDYIYKYIYSSSGTIKFKWCRFENIARINYNDSDRYPLYICEAAVTAAEILNCQVFNNNAGFKITSNSVLVQYSQFFKQLLNQAVYIIGAGTGIIISHNDFLYNYIGVELEDNAGTEVIKNNIFYTCLLYAIEAETAVTYTNSVENSVSYNATPGTQVIRSNPHYVNDGYVTLADMDLVLKSRELGYRFESPAIGIGDDLKNAGSVEYEISGGSQTWDTITVVKPKIKKGYNPVGAVETSYKDGSVESYRDSYTEVLKLEWDSVKEEDFEKLITLYFSSNNLVRIYLDPVTEPVSYGTYALIYDKVNASPNHWSFDDLGKNDFDLTFKRAYNEGV